MSFWNGCLCLSRWLWIKMQLNRDTVKRKLIGKSHLKWIKKERKKDVQYFAQHNRASNVNNKKRNHHHFWF